MQDHGNSELATSVQSCPVCTGLHPICEWQDDALGCTAPLGRIGWPNGAPVPTPVPTPANTQQCYQLQLQLQLKRASDSVDSRGPAEEPAVPVAPSSCWAHTGCSTCIADKDCGWCSVSPGTMALRAAPDTEDDDNYYPHPSRNVQCGAGICLSARTSVGEVTAPGGRLSSSDPLVYPQCAGSLWSNETCGCGM
jgi:hypothetical protein